MSNSLTSMRSLSRLHAHAVTARRRGGPSQAAQSTASGRFGGLAYQARPGRLAETRPWQLALVVGAECRAVVGSRRGGGRRRLSATVRSSLERHLRPTRVPLTRQIPPDDKADCGRAGAHRKPHAKLSRCSAPGQRPECSRDQNRHCPGAQTTS